MQAQEVPPYAEATGLGVPTQQAGPVSAEDEPDHGHKKKSVMGKVKDKARKLKTKIKKPKSPGTTGEDNDDSSNASSSEEEESGSDQQQQSGELAGDERDVVVQPGLKGQAFEAIPDPHADAAGGMHERFGQLGLGDDQTKLQEEIPSAPGQASAGVSPYIASHNLASQGIPVEGGKSPDGKDLVVTPASDDKGVAPMDYDQPSDVTKISDNTAAWYTPTSAEGEQQKPLKDRIVDGATAVKDKAADTTAATAATGAGALGLKSADESGNVERENTETGEEPKTTFDQAKERVFGTTEAPQGEVIESVGQNKPSMTSRAAGTMTGLKDTIASKLGYGSGKNLTRDTDVPLDTTTPTTQVDDQNPDNKSYLQKIQERAAGATAAVTNKLGYGDKQSPSAERSPSEAVTDEVNPGDNKPYSQKAREAAFGAKDAVAAKLGYGGTSTKKDVTSATEGDNKSYLQQAQESATSAKDAVASKLGYVNKDLPTAAKESAYGEENVPAGTAARFHPGEEDRALSELITEKMSTGAATVKDTFMKPFGSKSGPPTPTTTPPPSSAAAVETDPVHSTVSGTTVPQEEKPGIVGKMTGVMSSLLGTSPSGKKKAEEAAGKAMEDHQSQADVETH